MASDVSNVQYNADLCLAITRLPSTRSPLNPTDDHHDLHLQYVTQICTTSHSVANTPVHPARLPTLLYADITPVLLIFSAFPSQLPSPPPPHPVQVPRKIMAWAHTIATSTVPFAGMKHTD